jgi:hypothetical protein
MRRHELDPVSLTFGFVYAGLGLLFLLGRADQALRLHWIWPLLLIVLGVGILVDVARHRDGTTPPPAAEDVPGPDPDLAPAELSPDPADGAVDDRGQSSPG